MHVNVTIYVNPSIVLINDTTFPITCISETFLRTSLSPSSRGLSSSLSLRVFFLTVPILPCRSLLSLLQTLTADTPPTREPQKERKKERKAYYAYCITSPAMVGTATVDRFAPRRDERVTYIIREPERRHRFGISALAVGQDHLFSAGRDGTVRSWTLPALSTTPDDPSPTPSAPEAVSVFDEHVDWVNDVILVHGYERIVSASSDTTVKVWNANDASRSLRTLAKHTDYVKALAPVPNGVASGSLDGRVLVWDLVTGRTSADCSADMDDGQTRNGSVYCMAGSLDGNILVSGSTDRTISVWDVRTGTRVVHLRSHTDSVRCLTMSRNASCLLSGASDATVRLWDLRQERCLRSFDSYAGSVWAVAATDAFDSFVSGGRDGSVWHTSINDNLATLVVPQADRDARASMVLDVAPTHDASAVWVSTTGSSIRLWALPSAARTAELAADGLSGATTETANVDVNHKADAKATQQPEPLFEIPGLPGIIAQRIMNDRRHVLTCDTAGEYKIWDITRGILEKSLGMLDGDIDEVLKRHDVEVSVPSWFQVDIRLGSLLVRLEKSSVASAEVYAVDTGLEVPSEEIKVNIGEHVVHGLFKTWLDRQRQKGMRSSNEEESSASKVSSGGQRGTGTKGTPGQKGASGRTSDIPPYAFPDHIAVFVTEDQSPVPILRCTVGSFQGSEDLHMPAWVLELVRDGTRLPYEVVKVSFTLEPEEGTGLPALSTTTLTAPRVLRVAKVTTYVAKELKCTAKEDDPRDVRNSLDFEVEASHLEIVCNGQALPPNMSLATVRQFRWRSPDDLQLQFRLRTVT